MENSLHHVKTAACNHGLVLVQVGEDFNLERAVCNHGFFMMAPNRWIPSKKSLIRPLQLHQHNSHPHHVTVSITQKDDFLFVTVLLSKHHLPLSTHHRQHIRCQVSRMLRISERDEKIVKDFHSVHPEAKKVGFARIFRSPTLFEDIVKSILLCYCSWGRLLEMAEALCDLEQKLNMEKKRKRRRYPSSSSSSSSSSCNNNNNDDDDSKIECCCWILKFDKCMRNFPSPKQIAGVDEKTLNERCKLGFRASIIIQVAQSIENGSLDLGEFEGCDDHHMLSQRLYKIKGFGPFVVANIMMCLGFYQYLPFDTETIKHLQEVHGKTGVKSKKSQREVISQIYGKYAPFQCLAYWMEHVEYYEKRVGKLSELPHSKYRNVTTTNFQICNSEN